MRKIKCVHIINKTTSEIRQIDAGDDVPKFVDKIDYNVSEMSITGHDDMFLEINGDEGVGQVNDVIREIYNRMI